ncbi:MAG: hypothetical protein AB1633_05320 [Elusimicrobiota bacterium]
MIKRKNGLILFFSVVFLAGCAGMMTNIVEQFANKPLPADFSLVVPKGKVGNTVVYKVTTNEPSKTAAYQSDLQKESIYNMTITIIEDTPHQVGLKHECTYTKGIPSVYTGGRVWIDKSTGKVIKSTNIKKGGMETDGTASAYILEFFSFEQKIAREMEDPQIAVLTNETDDASITTPAGNFSGKHIVYKKRYRKEYLAKALFSDEIWMSEKVPVFSLVKSVKKASGKDEQGRKLETSTVYELISVK